MEVSNVTKEKTSGIVESRVLQTDRTHSNYNFRTLNEYKYTPNFPRSNFCLFMKELLW
jgi:hypothetical protein